jgi:Domain of unknown function (DUF1918)
MHAVVGDRLHVRGNAVGHPDRVGLIVEIRDSGGAPPYLVQFDDGRTCLIFPGPDAIVEHPPKKTRAAPTKAAPKRKTAKA